MAYRDCVVTLKAIEIFSHFYSFYDPAVQYKLYLVTVTVALTLLV